MIKSKNILRLAQLLSRIRPRFSSDRQQIINSNKYFRPVVNVEDFLNKLGIDHRSSASSFRIRECVFCTKPHYNEPTNMYTLNVNKTTGVFYCHRCAAKGAWSNFKARYLNTEAADIGSLMSNQAGNAEAGIPASETEFFFYLNNLKTQDYADVRQYLKEKGIREDIIEKYQVGAGRDTFITEEGKKIQLKCLYFPLYQPISSKKSKASEKAEEKATKISEQKLETNLVKYKITGFGKTNQKYSRIYPIGSKTGFFGFNTICKNDRVVVITEGQLNAMSVHQETGFPAIALPQGVNSLTDQLVPYLTQFEKIVIWLDNDAAGYLAEDKICFKVGMSRAYVVRNDRQDLKNANQYLLKAPGTIKSVINCSKTKPGENIIEFEDIKELVRNRIFRHEDYIGVQIDWLPFFNKKVKGIRMKELSVVSGPTGCGKTTFLSQVTLDLCKKKIPVLWGSFEIKNEQLITNMIIQYSQVNLYTNQELFAHYSEQFKNLPLYFLSFHGSNDVEKVLATIQYSIEKHNISVVVLDTLQFLLSDQAQGYQKFDLQDKVLSRLRRMATTYNVHIIIVIHPRKTQDNEDIQIHSIYGTSKAAQQADNIWMIQNREKFRIFDVKKNRFDGDVGKVAVGYNKNNKGFFQLKRNQLADLFSNETTIEKIVEKREEDQKNKGPQQESEQEDTGSNEDFINRINKTNGKKSSQL